MAIWVIKDGQREGPYEEQDLRELIYEGTYRDADSAIRDGQFDWTTLGQILGRQPPPSEPAPLAEPPPPFIPPEQPFALPESEPPPIPTAADTAPPELPATADSSPPLQVSVVDFQMPFGSMVILMVKWVTASLLALLIVGTIAAIFWIACVALIAAALRH